MKNQIFRSDIEKEKNREENTSSLFLSQKIQKEQFFRD